MEKEREKGMDVWEKHPSAAPHMPQPESWPHYPGMCPDQELNQQTSGPQVSAQSAEPHQPRLHTYFWLERKPLQQTRSRNFFILIQDICIHIFQYCFESPNQWHMMRKRKVKDGKTGENIFYIYIRYIFSVYKMYI